MFFSTFITASQKIWSARSNSLTAGRLDFAYAQAQLSIRTCWILVPHWKLLQGWFWWEVVRTLQMTKRSKVCICYWLLQCTISTGSCNSTENTKYRNCFFLWHYASIWHLRSINNSFMSNIIIQAFLTFSTHFWLLQLASRLFIMNGFGDTIE